MTEREQPIVKAILEALHEMDGGQLTEPLLHAQVNLKLPHSASLAEFNGALRLADSHGWITGITSKVTQRVKWNINDAGEAARLEM